MSGAGRAGRGEGRLERRLDCGGLRLVHRVIERQLAVSVGR